MATEIVTPLPTDLRAPERKWRKSSNLADLTGYQSLLSSFSSTISAAKTALYKLLDQQYHRHPEIIFNLQNITQSFTTTTDTNLSADIFAFFFIEKVAKNQ